MATLIDILLGVKLQNCDGDSTSTGKRSLSKVRSTTLSSAEAAFCMHKCFLDVLKSKSAVIRSATYSLLTSYIKHVPHVFDEETMKKLSPTILGAFHEKDASCHSSMWDTILVSLESFQRLGHIAIFTKLSSVDFGISYKMDAMGPNKSHILF